MDIQRPSRKKEIRRRRILFGILGALALAGITYGINQLEPAAREVRASELWIKPVEFGEMVRSVRGPGTLVPEEIRWVTPATRGRVEEILIDPGAEVSPETVIMELSNPELEQQVGDARLQLQACEAEFIDLEVRLESQYLNQEAQFAGVEADYQSAKLEAEANRELFVNKLIPEIELRRSEIRANQLQQRLDIEKQVLAKSRESNEKQLAVKSTDVAQRRALYELRRDQLEALKVKAGIQGVLQEVPAQVGQQVDTNVNLARVAEPTKLKAELRIGETQANDLLVGQRATIDTRNGVVEGKVTRIDPAVQNGTVTVDVALVGELPKGARPDLSVDGVIEIERLTDVLYVERPAYGQANSTIGLFKLSPDGSTASRVQVELGQMSVRTVEIVRGLSEGDRVILSDTSAWDDVDRIRLK